MTLLIFLACSPETTPDDTAGATDVLDARLTEADIATLEDGDILLFGPDITIDPGVEQMWCMYGTWPGGDAGIVQYETWEATYGHHVQIMGTTTPAIDAPDGSVHECTTSGQLGMENLEPLALPTHSYRDGVASGNYFNVPDGMAVKIDANQRYIIQSHVLNTGTVPVRQQDAALFKIVPVDEVETWMAPLVANTEAFSIPAHDVAQTSFDCTYDGDFFLLSALGHMHEWGTAISADLIAPDGVTETPLYDVPAWEATFRDAAPVFDFGDEGLSIPRGTTLRTNCAWNNTTDATLEFPSEMCVTVGFVYPSLTPQVCSR